MRPRPEQPPVALILKHLEKDDATVYDLEPVLGINRRNIRPYMRLLHEQRAIHIDRWECHGNGPKVAVWGLGDHPDATYPRMRTAAETQRLVRARRAWVKLVATP